MIPPVLSLAVSLALLGVASTAVAKDDAARATGPSIAVVVLRPVNIGSPDAVKKAIEQAVQDEGGRVVDASALGCSAADCYRRRAAGIGSTHLIIADAGYSEDFRFDLALDLLNVRTGYAVKRRDSCEPCTWPRAHEITRALARELALQAIADTAPAASGPGELPSRLSPPAGAAMGSDQPQSGAGRWAPWGLIVAGVAVGAYGATLWALDGKEAGCRSRGAGIQVCPEVYDSKGIGIPLTLAGGAAVAGGLTWLLLRGNGSGAPAVTASIGPGRLIVAGRF